VQFARQHQERLAVHDELGRRAAFFQMRRIAGCGWVRFAAPTAPGPKAREQQQDWQHAEIVSHNATESITGSSCWARASAADISWPQPSTMVPISAAHFHLPPIAQLQFHFLSHCARHLPGSTVEPWPSSLSISHSAAGPIWASSCSTGCPLNTPALRPGLSGRHLPSRTAQTTPPSPARSSLPLPPAEPWNLAPSAR
jgi:hypothetical protein